MGQMLQRLGRFIDGPPGAPRAVVERRIRRLVIVSAVLANAVGSLVVLVLATVVLPDPEEVRGHETLQRANVALFFGYTTAAIAVGVAVGLRVFRPMRRLFRTDRPLTEAEQRLVLRSPLLLMKVHGVLWGFAAVGWAGINLAFSPLMAVKLGLTVLLGGLTTCMIVHLVAERLFRPAAALALTTRVPAGSRVPGVVTRSVLAWGLGTAVPVLGVLLMGAASLSVADVSSRQLSWTMVALSGTALVVGVAVTYLAARAVADPIDSVRLAMARVERQDLFTEVPVYDGSEIGQLQAGFNQMVAGLREHELLQDLFGRQVGEDVARLALERGVELGGEVRDVAVIFVDLVGSTRLAATRPPSEVVALLNEFFAVIVQVVSAHGGWINKFEGDAALAIFGAPLDLPDGPARALAASREMASRLAVEVPSVTAAVGVSAGPAVAGHIGAEKRFEYTVIGDPVNEAARLTELAKKTPGLVLASGPALDAAGPDEASRWESAGEVVVRGRLEPTRLAAPRPAAM